MIKGFFAPTEGTAQLVIPPQLEDRTFLVHDKSDILNLSKCILLSCEMFSMITRWRDDIVVSQKSQQNLSHCWENNWFHVVEGKTLYMTFYMVPVWLNGVFWTRLLSVEPELKKELQHYFPVTKEPPSKLQI